MCGARCEQLEKDCANFRLKMDTILFSIFKNGANIFHKIKNPFQTIELVLSEECRSKFSTRCVWHVTGKSMFELLNFKEKLI